MLTREELLGYVSVSPNERFDYASVYYNQTQDVHPPLFYFLLHTVCSLFPGSYTKWTGLALNGTLLLCTLIALYSVCMSLFADWKKSLFTCMVYIFSSEALSDVLMIRMYMLLTLLTVLLALLVAESIHKPSVWKYLMIGILIYLGMMTQYFYVVYAFLLCAAYDIYLLYHRQWKNMVLFSVPALAGVGGMVLTFPCWYEQLHSQTVVSLDTVVENSKNIMEFPNSIMTMLRWNSMGFWTGNVIFALVILGAIAGKVAPKRFTNRIHIPTDVKLVTFPVLVAFAVISIIAPYKMLRYAYHLQPIEAILFGYGFFELIRPLAVQKKRLVACITLTAAVVSALCMEPEYLHAGDRKFNEQLESYKDAACVVLSENTSTTVTAVLNQLLVFPDACVAECFSDETLTGYIAQKKTDEVILFVETNPIVYMSETGVEELCKENGYEAPVKFSGNVVPREGEFSRVYLLRKKSNAVV